MPGVSGMFLPAHQEILWIVVLSLLKLEEKEEEEVATEMVLSCPTGGSAFMVGPSGEKPGLHHQLLGDKRRLQ